MLHKQLLKTSKEAEPLHRKRLFKTTCKSKGKVCKVVVDFGSIENMVSCEMVNKLNLKRIPHEFPYKVSWLSNGQSLLVNEQAIIDF